MFSTRVFLICLFTFVGYGCQTTSNTTEETEQKEEQQQEQQTQSEASQSQEASEAKQSAQAQESSESQSSKQAQNADEQAEKAPEPAFHASQEQQAAEESTSQAPDDKRDSEAGAPASETDVLAQALEAFEQAGQTPSGGQPPPSGTEKGEETAANNGVNESAEKSQNEPPAGVSPAGAQTKSEKIAGLDRKLESAYATFDGAILREREYIKGKENARGSVNADLEEERVSSAGEGDELNIPGANPEENAEYSSKHRPGDAEEGGDQQTRVASAVSVPPPDIPSGTDDDVVARQLREAALKEPDPELREKLWDEYRKYKKLPPRQK